MASQLQAREYLILGDSNVSRFYTKIGLTLAQNIDFIPARNVEELTSGLTKINRSYKFVIMAFWSNLVSSAGEAASNDVDRMSAIDDLFNQVIPLLRLASLILLFTKQLVRVTAMCSAFYIYSFFFCVSIAFADRRSPDSVVLY